MRFLVATLFISAGIVGTAIGMNGSSPEQKVDSVLLAQMEKESFAKFPILIVLTKQADLSGAAQLTSKSEKGSFVYKQLVDAATSTQGELLSLLRGKNLEVQPFFVANMIAVHDADEALVKELAKREDVAKVLNNNPKDFIRPVPTTSEERSQVEPQGPGLAANIKATGAPSVWADLKVDGTGIVVAGQDTGVEYTHDALKRQYRGTETKSHDYNWHDAIRKPIGSGRNSCGFGTEAPCDDGDHGSHTMGTIVGADGKGTTIGMAPNAQWIACRNMDDGTGTPSTYIDCFQFFLAPTPVKGDAFTQGAPELAPHVINNSWGCPSYEGCFADEMTLVLRAMKSAGIMVVVSAGNDGSSCKTINAAPAYHTQETFSVGAMNHVTGKIASFSSRGPSTFDGGMGPDVVAPGVAVLSSVTGNRYESSFWSGTSMSGPHVAGLVALMWSANKNLIGKIEETEEMIRATATKVVATDTCDGDKNKVPNNTFGHGVINAVAAVKAALQ